MISYRHQIKLFKDHSIGSLERQVNEWLLKNKHCISAIHSIQHQISGSDDYCSVMIYYTESYDTERD